jgi:hypothetical protein
MTRRVLRELLKHAKVHNGHGSANLKANVLYNQRIAYKYLKKWVLEYREHDYVESASLEARSYLSKLRRKNLFAQWKQVVVAQ